MIVLYACIRLPNINTHVPIERLEKNAKSMVRYEQSYYLHKPPTKGFMIMVMYQRMLFLFIVCLKYTTLYSMLTSADLSCDTPVTIFTSTTILLDTDVTVTDTCALITAGPLFGSSAVDTVTFTSLTGNKLVVADNGTWNPATFNSSNKRIQFLDNVVLAVNDGGTLTLSGFLHILGAQLALYRGATMWLKNCTILNEGTIDIIPAGQ